VRKRSAHAPTVAVGCVSDQRTHQHSTISDRKS